MSRGGGGGVKVLHICGVLSVLNTTYLQSIITDPKGRFNIINVYTATKRIMSKNKLKELEIQELQNSTFL